MEVEKEYLTWEKEQIMKKEMKMKDNRNRYFDRLLVDISFT